MGWKILLVCFIGSIAATATNGGWRENTEYNYDVEGRTLSGHPDVGNQYSGIILKYVLNIVVRSNGILVVTLRNPKYAKVHTQLSDGPCTHIPHEKLKFTNLHMVSSHAEVEVKNGIVKRIRIQKHVPNWEVNMIKSILSQLQLDTSGENLIKSTNNILPNVDSPSGAYKTMEESILGKYEVLYEINQLPEIKYQDNQWLVPHPELKGDGKIMEIIKTKNFENDKKHVGYHRGLNYANNLKPFSNNMGDFFSRFSVSKVTVSGKLNNYIIQSVETTNDVHVSPAHNSDQKMMVSSLYKLSLSSVTVNTFPPPPLDNPSKYVDLKSLVYQYNNPLSNIDEQNQQNSDIFGAEAFGTYPRDWKRATRQTLPETDEQNQEETETSDSDSVEESVRDWKRETTEHLPAPMHPLNVGYMGNSVKLAKGANVPNSVIHLAQDIAHDLKKPGDMPQAQTLSKFIKLNQLMRLLDEKDLQTVANKLYCNERDSHVCYTWKVFCDGLAESGTLAALMEVQRLILEKKLSTETAVYMIPQMINSVRVPNYRYMRTFYKFSTHPDVESTPVLGAAAILSFSRLVGDVLVDKNFSRNQFPIYVYGSFDTPEGNKCVTDEFIPYLIKQLDNAIEKKDNSKAQVYINSLGYVGHPKMLNGFKKYLEGKKEVSHFLRSQMVYSLWRMSYLFPEEAQPILNRLYGNSAEHTDVRIAALQLLPLTTPSASMFQKIAVNIYFDLNKQVNAAADSMIRTLADYQSNMDLQIKARSAVHLLPKRKYGSQYSATNFADNHISEAKTNFNELLYLVGSDDSVFNKFLVYGLLSGSTRLEQTIFSVDYLTNSIEALMKTLRSETENSSGEQDGSDSDRDSKWSSEQVRRMLKIKPNQLESPEGNMYFGMNGLERYFFFDVNNLSNIKKVIEDIKESLKKGKDIRITKFIDQQEMAIGCPTETGLPTWYSSDNPLLVNIEGHVSGDLQTQEKSNHLQSIDIDSRIRVVISKKMQDRVGFVAPFEHHHYMAGHDVNAQVHLPLKIKVKANMNKNIYEVKLEPSTNEKLIPVVHFSTVPYTSRSNILKLRPVVGDSETHIINSKPKGQFNTVVGQNAMGMSWHVHIACEHSILRDGKLFNAIGDHSLASSLFMHLFHGYIHNSKLEICFDAENSNKEMNIQAAYEQWKKTNPQNNKSNNDNENESDVARKLFDSQDPKKEVMAQVSEQLSSPTVDLYQLKFSYHSKHDIEYTNIAGVAKSDTKERNKMIVVSSKHDRQQPDKNYRSVLLTRSQTPNVNAIDPLFALKHAPSSNSHLKLVFGKNYESATKINASIEMSRSHDRNRCLQGSQIAHDCKKESEKGNLLLKACSQLHLEANSLDQVRIQLQHKNLKPEHQNMTNHLVNYVKHLFYENMEENSVNATGSGADNKVNIKINFHEDFARVNITKNTENKDVQFNNVHVPSWLRPVVKVHPTYNALARLQSKLFESQWYQASCAVDKSAVRTFDNKTYSVKQGDWTVMFLYVPNCVNKRINSHENTHDEEGNCGTNNRNKEEFLVLTRNLNKEIKITIRTPETKYKLIEIDMIQKGKSNVEVHVNQKLQNLRTDRVIEVANGFIKMILLPNQEVQLDVQHAFTMFYDGARARLTTDYKNKFRNKVRGLCGNFDSQPSNDWYAPQTCVYNNVEHFVASYQPYRKDPRPDQSKGNKCSYQEVIYGNVIPRNDDDTCFEYKRVYTMIDNFVCITVSPVRVCKLGCVAQETIQQIVLANCMANDDSAQRLIKNIEDNKDLDESSLGSNNLKRITLRLPKYCSQPL